MLKPKKLWRTRSLRHSNSGLMVVPRKARRNH